MKIIKTQNLTKDQKNTLYNLFNNEYPAVINFTSFSDFENYLKTLNNPLHFFLLNEKNQIQGWAYLFTREKGRWFGILLDSKIQKQGFGSLLINKLKSIENHLNGWVVENDKELKKNGEPYLSPIAFYQKNDFTIDHSIRLETEKLTTIKIEWSEN
jgi:hypothetical protein